MENVCIKFQVSKPSRLRERQTDTQANSLLIY